MAKKKKRGNHKSNSSGRGDNKLYAFLASFFTIIGFIVALFLWKDNRYVMHYAKQGLVIFIAQVVLVVLSPFLFFVGPILGVILVILWIITWVNSLTGKTKDTFLIGDLAKKINL